MRNERDQVFQIDKSRNFSDSSDHQSFGTVRLSLGTVKKLGGRNTFVRIEHGDRFICRQVQGIGRQKIKCSETNDELAARDNFTASAIELDYDSCLELGISSSRKKLPNNFYECDLQVKKARLKDVFTLHWNHPNPAYKTPFQISLVSLALGIIGLILGLLGFVSG